MVKTEVGEDIWDLDISRWGDVAIMGVEGKLAGGEFGMMNANKESFFFFNNFLNFSMKLRKVIHKTFMDTSVAREQP